MLLLQFSLLNIGPKSQALYIINDLVKKKKKKGLLFCCYSCSFARNYAGQGKPSHVDINRQNF